MPLRIIARRWSPFALALAGSLCLTGCSAGTSAPSTPIRSSPGAAATSVYVLEGTPLASHSVAQLSATANGSTPPLSTLTLPEGFRGSFVTTGSSGQIYVLGSTCDNCEEVLVYAAGATATASPLRTITVPISIGTGITALPSSIAVDSAGFLYLADPALNLNSGTVWIYAPTATGAATPVRSVSGSNANFNPLDIAIDSSGNLYVETGVSVLEYPPTANGNATPTRTISGAGASLAVDPEDNLYVLDNDGPGQISVIPPATATPVRTISLTAQLPLLYIVYRMRVDAAGNIYVVGATSTVRGYPPQPSTGPAVFVFGPNTDSVPPTATILLPSDGQIQSLALN